MLANGVVNAIGIIWDSHCNALSINDKQNHSAFKVATIDYQWKVKPFHTKLKPYNNLSRLHTL